MGRRDPDEKLVAPADFNGPVQKRRCTDIFFSLLILAMWGAMSYLGYISFTEGDYRVVIYPLDYDGNICGMKYAGKDMREYPYLYYVNFVGGGVCVKECPDLTPTILSNATNSNETISDEDSLSDHIDPFTLVTYAGVYQLDGFSTSKSELIQVANYSDSENVIACTGDTCFPNNDPFAAYFSDSGINQGFGYAFYLLDTVEFMNRCFPTAESFGKIQNVTGDTFIDIEELQNFGFYERFYGDCWRAKEWILGFGFCAALVMSFLYLFLVRVPCVLEIMVWGSIILTDALIIGGGYYIYYMAGVWEAADPQTYSANDIQNAKIVSYVVFAIGGLFFVLMVYLRKEIQLALSTVEETSKAINAMPALSLYPIFECIGLLVFLAVWMVYAVFLASLGTMTLESFGNPFNDVTVNVRVFEFDDRIVQSAWFLLFCLYWTYQFIISMGEIIVAMSIAKWYFTRDKSSVGSGTVFKSISTSFFYHIGTAAFGSLILAILRIFRTILAKIQKSAKDADNKLAEVLLCSCSCCMWCLDNFLRFMNKNAFIQTAIFGTSFCESAFEAFNLIARNIKKVGAITYVSEAVSIIGKLFITVATGAGSYFAIDYFIGNELTSLAGPIVLILILAYNVSDAFMDIFEIGVSTILHCFVADDEMFTEEESFAGGDLKKFIDDWEQ